MSFEDDLAAALQGVGVDPSTVPPPSLGAISSNQQAGKAILAGILRSVGLDSPDMTQYVTNLVTSGGSISDWQSTLTADLYDKTSTPGKIVAQKYPAIFTRQAQGLPPITVGQYQSYASSAAQLAQRYGLPSGFLDQNAIDQRIADDTSLTELDQRFQGYQQAAYQVPQSDRDELQRLYGIGPGELTAFYADPKRSLPLIQKQFLSAQESGAAVRSGFGGLTQNEAEQFASAGVTPDQALKATGQLVNEQQLFDSLPGEGADSIDRSTQLAGAVGGNAAAQLRIAQRAAARRAAMEQNGAFATGKTGVEGLGVSTT